MSESDKEEAEAEINQKYGPRTHNRLLQDKKPPKYAPRYNPNSFEDNMAQFEQLMGMLFMTEQMSLQRGLKRFGMMRWSLKCSNLRSEKFSSL